MARVEAGSLRWHSQFPVDTILMQFKEGAAHCVADMRRSTANGPDWSNSMARRLRVTNPSCVLMLAFIALPLRAQAGARAHPEFFETLRVLTAHGCPAPTELIDAADAEMADAEMARQIRRDFELRLSWALRVYACSAEGGDASARIASASTRSTDPVTSKSSEKAARTAAAGAQEEARANPGKESNTAENSTSTKADDAKTKADLAKATSPAAAGVDTKPDYLSKYFALTIGGVVLDPFELNPVDGSIETRWQLETGQTEANFLAEASFRRRWAWLDRLPVMYADRSLFLTRSS